MEATWLTGIARGLPCLPHLLMIVVVVVLLVLLLAALARAITYLLMRQLLGKDCCAPHGQPETGEEETPEPAEGEKPVPGERPEQPGKPEDSDPSSQPPSAA
jgi:hypothetical protein